MPSNPTPYLSSLALENFRTFRNFERFEFAPLTIITGPNSSGKSSLLKALLLLKDNARPNQISKFDFSSGLHRLSSFEKMRTHGVSEPITFELGIRHAFGASLPAKMQHRAGDTSEPMPRGRTSKVPRDEKSWDWPDQYFVTVKIRDNALEAFDLSVEEEGVRERLFSMGPQQNTPYVYEWKGESRVDDAWRYEVRVNTPWFYRLLGGGVDSVADALEVERDGFFDQFAHAIDNEVVFYTTQVGPKPKLKMGHITWLVNNGDCMYGGASEEVNEWSSAGYFERFRRFTLAPLLTRALKAVLDQLEAVEYSGLVDAAPPRLVAPTAASRDLFRLAEELHDKDYKASRINEWLERFGIGEELEVEKVEDIGYMLRVRREGRSVSVADIGQGHAQMLPLILHLGLRGKKSTLLLEEPESNLHPNLQSSLADLFLDLVGDVDEYPQTEEDATFDPETGHLILPRTPNVNVLSKRLIVETHSEYLIRRLQYLVASGEADSSRVTIYYVGTDNHASDYVRRISIAENGQLTGELGPGFLDEATNLMVDLFKYGSQN